MVSRPLTMGLRSFSVLIRTHHSDSLDEVRLIAERRPMIAAMSAQERRPRSLRTVVSLC